MTDTAPKPTTHKHPRVLTKFEQVMAVIIVAALMAIVVMIAIVATPAPEPTCDELYRDHRASLGSDSFDRETFAAYNPGTC